MYEYFSNGSYLVRSYDEDSQLVYKREYGTEGYSKEMRYNISGNIYYVWHVGEYDANGRYTKTTNYNADGTISSYIVYEYDADGNWTTTDYNSDGTARE